MSKHLKTPLLILLIPVLLVLFALIHETGHTLLARWFGDPNSTFYLMKIDESGECLGCNITDHSKLSDSGNLWVSLGGLLFTQISAVALLLLGAWMKTDFFPKSSLGKIGLTFAFLDVSVQLVQGLAYDISKHVFPTGVDMMDFILLTSKTTGLGQSSLKAGLTIVAVFYLIGVLRLYTYSIRKLPPEFRKSDDDKET